MPDSNWNLKQLEDELKKFERELREAGFKENTLHNYTGRTRTFLRWLAGEYRPKNPSR